MVCPPPGESSDFPALCLLVCADQRPFAFSSSTKASGVCAVADHSVLVKVNLPVVPSAYTTCIRYFGDPSPELVGVNPFHTLCRDFSMAATRCGSSICTVISSAFPESPAK